MVVVVKAGTEAAKAAVAVAEEDEAVAVVELVVMEVGERPEREESKL